MIKYILFAAILLGLGVAGTMHAVEETKLPFVVSKGKPAESSEFNFTLTGSDGKPHSSKEWRGKFVLLYFGFTHCPDICPAGLSQITATLKMLGEQAKQIQPVFVTVDVVRDTPEQLHEFMQNFHPDFVALTGAQQDIDKVTDAYGIVVRQRRTESGISYDYTADTVLLNKDGEVVGYFPYGITSAEMVELLQEWLK